MELPSQAWEKIQRVAHKESRQIGAARRGPGCCTLLSVGAASIFWGYSLFPNILKYNKGHNDSINESNQNELKVVSDEPIITNLYCNNWEFGIRMLWNLTLHVLWGLGSTELLDLSSCYFFAPQYLLCSPCPCSIPISGKHNTKCHDVKSYIVASAPFIWPGISHADLQRSLGHVVFIMGTQISH